MSVDLRPPTADELKFVRLSWYRTFRPRYTDARGMGVRGRRGHPWTANDRAGVFSHATAKAMLRSHIAATANASTVLVAAVDVDGESEAIGWVCRSIEGDGPESEGLAVHCVYVRPGARREGVGAMLLNNVHAAATDGEVFAAAMNGPGLGLWKACE